MKFAEISTLWSICCLKITRTKYSQWKDGSWWPNGLVLHGGSYILTTTLLRNFLRKLDVWWQRMEMMMRKSDHRGLNLTRSRDNHVHCTKHQHWCVHLIWSNVDWHLFTSSNLFIFYSTHTAVYTVNNKTCFVLYNMELIGKQGQAYCIFPVEICMVIIQL